MHFSEWKYINFRIKRAHEVPSTRDAKRPMTRHIFVKFQYALQRDSKRFQKEKIIGTYKMSRLTIVERIPP